MCLIVGVDSTGVAVTFVGEVRTCDFYTFFEVLVAEGAHYGTHLFLTDNVFCSYAASFNNENTGTLGLLSWQ